MSTFPPTDGADYGAAMLAAVFAHSSKVEDRRDGTVDFNAWWRAGDSLKVRLWPDKGAWRDIKTGDGGNAQEFASVALGLNLRGMLEQYGRSTPRPAQPTSIIQVLPPPPAPADAWTDELVRLTWEAHVDRYHVRSDDAETALDELAPMRVWLHQTRGIPPTARLESGILPAHAELFPAGVMVDSVRKGRVSIQTWVADVLAGLGPAVLVPMRCANTNRVNGLVLRFMQPRPFKPGEKPVKSLTVKGIRRDPSAPPQAFGWAGASVRADQLLVVEGAPDLWAVEALAPAGTVVVGVNGVWGLASNGTPGPWATWLAQNRTGKTVLVPQSDRSGTSQNACAVAAKEMVSRGAPVAVFRFSAWAAELDAAGAEMADVKDAADATKAAAAAGVPWEFVRGSFGRALASTWTTRAPHAP